MNTLFGPWTTGMAGRSPVQLNSHWKRRLHMLSTLPSGPACVRRATLVVIGILAVSLWALPLLKADGPDSAQAAAGEENADDGTQELSVEQMRLLEQALTKQLDELKKRIEEESPPAEEAADQAAGKTATDHPAEDSAPTDDWWNAIHVNRAATYLNQGNFNKLHGFQWHGWQQQCTECHAQQALNWNWHAHPQLASGLFDTTNPLAWQYAVQRANTSWKWYDLAGLDLRSAQTEREVSLSRKTYKLPSARAAALAKVLPELTGTDVLETTHDGDSLTVTTTPEAQKAVTRLIGALREEAD